MQDVAVVRELINQRAAHPDDLCTVWYLNTSNIPLFPPVNKEDAGLSL